MKIFNLLECAKFADVDPHAEPLHVDKLGRVLLYALRPGQTVREHNSPHSPVYLSVLQGEGMFAGGDATEVRLGPNMFMLLNQGEMHSVRALDDDLIFLTILHGSPWSQ